MLATSRHSHRINNITTVFTRQMTSRGLPEITKFTNRSTADTGQQLNAAIMRCQHEKRNTRRARPLQVVLSRGVIIDEVITVQFVRLSPVHRITSAIGRPQCRSSPVRSPRYDNVAAPIPITAAGQRDIGDPARQPPVALRCRSVAPEIDAVGNWRYQSRSPDRSYEVISFIFVQLVCADSRISG